MKPRKCSKCILAALERLAKSLRRIDGSPEEKRVHASDACKIVELRFFLQNGNFIDAYDAAYRLDTVIRDDIPDALWRFLNEFKNQDRSDSETKMAARRINEHIPKGLTEPLPKVLSLDDIADLAACANAVQMHNKILTHFRGMHPDLDDVVDGNIINESKLYDLLAKLGHELK